MRAKDLAAKYNLLTDQTEKENFAAKTAQSYFVEIGGIIKQRKAKNDSAILSVFREQDACWRAFVRRTDLANNPKSKGLFSWYAKECYPNVYKIWMDLEAKCGHPKNI